MLLNGIKKLQIGGIKIIKLEELDFGNMKKKSLNTKWKEIRKNDDPRNRINSQMANNLQDSLTELLYLGIQANTDKGYAIIASRLDTILDLLQMSLFHLNHEALCATTDDAAEAANEATAEKETTLI